MLWSLLLPAALAAGDPAADASVSSDTDTDADAGAALVLQAAEDLRDQGQLDAARATLDALLRQPLTDSQRDQAQALRAQLPLSRAQLGAMTRLAVGQAVMGGYLLGPHLARLSYDPQRSAAPYYLGAFGGAALGAGAGIWLGSRPGFDGGEADLILTSEVLGGATGVAIGLLADKHDRLGPSWGVLAGVGGGAGLGLVLAGTDPTPADALAVQSGAGWGMGLVTAGLVIGETDGSADAVVVPLVVGADLGAVAGWLIADRFDLTRRQLAFFDVGGLVGAGGGFLVVGIASAASDGELTPQAGAVIVTTSAIAGGLAAAWFAGPERGGRGGRAVAHAALWGSPGDLHLSLPLPSAAPGKDGAHLDLQLVDYRF